MHRIDHATAAPGALFTEGNPATATPATTVTDDWLNDVQENVCAAIEAAGITLVKGTTTQLRDAINALIASFMSNDFKASVRIATTANIGLNGLAAIDGVTPIAGDRILVKDQGTGSQNGIWLAAAGAWSRATDADTGTELNGGALVSVEEGTTNAETIWALANDGAVTIGTTALVFQWAAGLKGVTAAQFDNSRLLATTAFLKAAGLRFSKSTNPLTATILTAADAGSLVLAGGGSPYTITLPSQATFPQGEKINFLSNATAAVTIGRAGSDTILTGSASITSIVLNPGDSLSLTSYGSGIWVADEGSAHLGYAGAFLASKATNGYQKLPGGLILQWGETGNVTAGGTLNVTLPITFPNAFLQCQACLHGGPSSGLIGAAIINTSTIQVTNGAGSAASTRWLAIGH